MDLKPSPSVKSRTIPAACSPGTGPMSPATTTCEPSQQPGLLPMELPLMSSAAGSRARTLASLENGLALKVRALVSGESMPASLANYDPASSSWRTSQACLISGWEKFSETWPRSGTTRHGIAYQLPPLALPTDATGCGLLPTCTAMAATFTENTARAKFPNLETVVARMMWPTPTVMTNTGGAAMCKWGGSGARAKLRSMTTPEELNGALNPDWVEWLMGYPIGYTSLSGCHESRKASRTGRKGSKG